MSETIAPQATSFHLDETSFLQKVPFKVNPTSLAGAYSVPAPPDSLDLKSASSADLIKNGLLWRQPAAGDPPGVQAAWNAFLSRKWMAADRIVPVMEVQHGVTHNLRRQPTLVPGSNTNYNDNAWAGAGTKTGKWTSIIGTWNVPTVSKPSEAQGTEGGWNSSSWVGLDGFFYTNDVLQAGIQQHVAANGSVYYVAWYEWYAPITAGSPGYVYQTNIANFPISPGNQISVSVQYMGTTAGSISMGNNTTGKHFSITLNPPPGASFNGGSCEWIFEAPDGGEPTSSIPKFTPVTFTSALACGANSTTANPATGDTLNIENAAGKILTKTTVGTDTCTISFIG
jgi:hypothetical protein